ncbi:MAG: DJ-1/PfpI family protein [Paludibacteraceae bacterium]|nr:DJ-1/PfpI family protein [Paludibacteraceae bacterium]
MNYLFLDNGFEEIEAVTTIDLLRRAGIELTTVSMTDSKEVHGAHGIDVKADVMFETVDFSDAGMLILPGGGLMLGEHENLCRLLVEHNNEGKLISAICAAPAILGKLGILEGKQATCYPGFESALGESYIGGLVVVSKNLITAKGPGLSSDFAFSIIERLLGEEAAEQVYDTAQY